MAFLGPPNTQPFSVAFRTYTSEEIKKLSVKEITNSQFFTELGTPVPGGLYDSALGPSEKNDICSTCLLSPLHCPGHLGHVTLPLPVFNPLYIRLMVQLLHGSCLKCHHLATPQWALEYFLCKLKLINSGHINIIDKLDQDLFKLRKEEAACEMDAEGGVDIEAELDVIISTTLGMSLDDIQTNAAHTNDRCIAAHRNQMIDDFIRDYVSKRGKKCRRCRGSLHSVKLENNIRLLTKGIDKSGKLTMVTISVQEAREHLRQLYQNDKHIISKLYGMFVKSEDNQATDSCPIDQLFIEVLPIIPSRFRPVSGGSESLFSNAESLGLASIIQTCDSLREIVRAMKKANRDANDDAVNHNNTSGAGESTLGEKLQRTWYELQTLINCTVDSDLDKLNKFSQKKGIKQTLERKEGIFRKFMMGKRVNYAARSVISPDPYINSDQIGIPEIIAKKLTYPEPVTDRNIHELRQAVKNGPNVHPGAVAVEVGPGKVLRLNASNQTSRDAMANRLMAPSDVLEMSFQKKVHRHIRTGDVVLLNRQPTLHKPSIMAHKVRILVGEKTLRLHYSACKTYNADFDGDEMNVHFPQNEMGRAEALMIANTTEQYIVPKDGTPLAGLIQDHMIAGVHITVRGRFFTRSQYQQLVFAALMDKRDEVQLLPPSMMKPALLWSGKQVISTVLLNIIPKDKQLLNFVGKTKVKDKSWVTSSPRNCEVGGTITGSDMSEAEVIIRQGELLCGILDKENYGPTPYGMVHCCYEIYGGQVGVAVLSCLGRLFTTFLQQIAGFSLGIKDIIVLPQADKKRQKYLKNASQLGVAATARALGVENQGDREEMTVAFEAAHRGTGDKEIKDIDLQVKGATDKLSEDIRCVCLPKGLLMKFPENNLQMMILSGAKGSQVNALQISCLLGQIELEGKRPPLMTSGRSLPSFMSYDSSLRAGGFVAGRFLTGIRPQEYFFHCMAGREGLIDTAVKTSRSGYLQRCIIKHLEGLVVNYDLTVRDSDSSIVQFSYGEDGLDISQTPFLKRDFFKFLMENEKLNKYPTEGKTSETHLNPKKAEKIFKQVRKWRHKSKGRLRYTSGFVGFTEGKTAPLVEQFKVESPKDSLKECHRKAKQKLVDSWRECPEKENYIKANLPCPDPAHSQLQPNQNFGAVSERMKSVIEDYLNEFPQRIFCDGEQCWSRESFKQLIYRKYRRSLCEPGEAVGLLAAQSIGEPSTQMTLNTFHFAGRGEMNVTLGIPRLREILMVASRNIKTPGMVVPVKQSKMAHWKSGKLCQKLTKVVLADLLEDMNVWESYLIRKEDTHCSVYKIRLGLLSKEDYKSDVALSPSLVLKFMEKSFFRQLAPVIRRKIRDLQSMRVFRTQGLAKDLKADISSGQDENNEMCDEIQDDEEEKGDTEEAKKQNHQLDDYDEGDAQEQEDDKTDDLTVERGVEDEDEVIGDQPEKKSPDEVTTTSLENQTPSTRTSSEIEQINRIRHVIDTFELITSYDFDQKESLWCEFTIEVQLMDSGRLDIPSIITDVTHQTVIHQARGIERCIVADDKGNKLLQTEGVNLKELYKYDSDLDLHKMYTNDVHAMARTFGIEAACCVLVKEITDVFQVYGIEVDRRHLSLIADYMTYDGYYKPFSRMGLETNPSTIQKMTFESCLSVLRKATIRRTRDTLQSPSARLVLGRVVSGGTGCFDVFPKVF